MILTLRHSAAPSRRCTQPFYSDSAQHLQHIEEVLFGHFMTTLNDAFKWQLTLEDIGCKSGSESLSVPTPLHREPQPFHALTQENFSFGPATPRGHPSPGSLHAVCCQLTYKEDDESMPHHSPEDDIPAHCLPSIAEEGDDRRTPPNNLTG